MGLIQSWYHMTSSIRLYICQHFNTAMGSVPRHVSTLPWRGTDPINPVTNMKKLLPQLSFCTLLSLNNPLLNRQHFCYFRSVPYDQKQENRYWNCSNYDK